MYKNILVPIDLSHKSCISLKKAIKYAHIFKSKMILLNVHEEFLNKDEMIMSRVSIGKLQKSFKNISIKSKDEISNLMKKYKGNSKKTEIILRKGKASNQILDIAEKYNCDLIIIGSNGKDSIRDYFVGTTTENVINQTTIPVLVITN